MINAVIIDDMSDALELLSGDISTHCPKIKVVGTANSAISGAQVDQTSAAGFNIFRY